MYGIVAVCSMMVLAVSAGGESEQLQTRLCGRYLVDTLVAVCNGVFNTWSKKSHAAGDVFPMGLNDDNWQPLEEGQNGILPWPWHHGPAALRLRSQRRKRQGVYNECCEKRCSLNELRSYCGQ